ncbi:hypothetical protein L6452_27404 [Arctium lappa]|uniref:Uncharacterized protein n=1 Tax=Arctium lappa TaxID=4217 RepID=A0ACB9A0K4_ARCLA|nr:hypothetical protein L6452_27404 [Arctium lappa]
MSDESVNQQTHGDVAGGRNTQKKPSGYGRKAKRVVLSRIRTTKKDKEIRPSSISRSSSRCCLCVKRIPTLDSCTESPTSDPNSSDFTFDSLKGLIEKSDFFLNECNTHLDWSMINYSSKVSTGWLSRQVPDSVKPHSSDSIMSTSVLKCVQGLGHRCQQDDGWFPKGLGQMPKSDCTQTP